MDVEEMISLEEAAKQSPGRPSVATRGPVNDLLPEERPDSGQRLSHHLDEDAGLHGDRADHVEDNAVFSWHRDA